jgi:hypothetical protein
LAAGERGEEQISLPGSTFLSAAFTWWTGTERSVSIRIASSEAPGGAVFSFSSSVLPNRPGDGLFGGRVFLPRVFFSRVFFFDGISLPAIFLDHRR